LTGRYRVRARPLTRTLGGGVLAAGLLVAGCTAFPAAGPTASQVVDQSSRDGTVRFATPNGLAH